MEVRIVWHIYIYDKIKYIDTVIELQRDAENRMNRIGIIKYIIDLSTVNICLLFKR